MHPFFDLGGVRLPAYGTMVALGVLIGAAIFFVRLPRAQRKRAAGVLGAAAVGALVGAKGIYLLTAPQGLSLAQKLLSGFVFYGGLLGGLAGGAVACRALRLGAVGLLDAAAPAIAIGHGIGRVGCFLAGCCYGRPMPPPFGIVMPEALGAPHDVALFPVQLLEAALNILLGVFLLLYSGKPREEGRTSGLYLMLYAVVRFSLEFLRYDAVRGFAGALSTGQWMSLGALALGAALFGRIAVVEVRLRGADLVVRAGLLRVETALRRDAKGKLHLEMKVLGVRVPIERILAAAQKKAAQKPRRKPGEAVFSLSARQALELVQPLRVRQLEVDAVIGVMGDAALTAKLCGGVQAALGTLCAVLQARQEPFEKRCAIRPDYQKDVLKVCALCIIFFQTGKVMRVGCKILLENAKGAYRRWRTRLKTSCVPPWRT